MNERVFKREELLALGLGDPWECDNVEHMEKGSGSHGVTQIIVFSVPGSATPGFWRIEVGYHPEDWSGTNDIVDCSSLKAVEVYPVQVTTNQWNVV